MKIEKRWIVSFIIISLVAITGLLWQHEPASGDVFNTEDSINFADVAWMLTASCLVLLMTPGLSFFYGGMVGKKNVISTMLKSFICLGVISLLWVVVGFSLSFLTLVFCSAQTGRAPSEQSGGGNSPHSSQRLLSGAPSDRQRPGSSPVRQTHGPSQRTTDWP